MNDLLDDLCQSSAAEIFLGKKIPVIAYCDDLLVFATSPEKLRQLIAICDAHSKKWKYSFSPDKCKLISFNDPQNNPDWNDIDDHVQNLIQNEFQSQIPENKQSDTDSDSD